MVVADEGEDRAARIGAHVPDAGPTGGGGARGRAGTRLEPRDRSVRSSGHGPSLSASRAVRGQPGSRKRLRNEHPGRGRRFALCGRRTKYLVDPARVRSGNDPVMANSPWRSIRCTTTRARRAVNAVAPAKVNLCLSVSGAVAGGEPGRGRDATRGFH